MLKPILSPIGFSFTRPFSWALATADVDLTPGASAVGEKVEPQKKDGEKYG